MAKKPRLKSRKLPPCGPVDVPAVWKRIEAAVGTLAPDLIRNFASGATDKQIKTFEKAIGRKLPKEVRQSFRAHNGQRGEWAHQHYLFHSIAFCSLDWARQAWKFWDGLGDQEDIEEQIRDIGRSTPKDAIRLGYANSKWIQLIDTGSSCYFGLDFDPGPKGLAGQIINFGRNEEYKNVWAWSWGWFLNDLAEELEAGNFRYTEDGLIIIDPDPPHGCFFHIGEQWSKAKTVSRRPFDPLSAEALAPLRADTNVMQLARTIAKTCDFGVLPILADALEEAGCTDKRFLAHCRKSGEHGCGCWAVNLLLGDAPEFVIPSAAPAK